MRHTAGHAAGGGVVYLLHFDRPLSAGHTTQHYCGYTTDLATRLKEHASGAGARLTRVALRRGIGWTLARVWTGQTRRDERRRKAGRHGRRLCPVCREQPQPAPPNP